MNASICFGNAKKFLLEVKRLEQVRETEREKSGGSWVVDSGMKLADQHAADAMAALLKVTFFETFFISCYLLSFFSFLNRLFCFVLFCFVLFCFVLFCFVWFCILYFFFFLFYFFPPHSSLVIFLLTFNIIDTYFYRI
jgi:hypothetical protein